MKRGRKQLACRTAASLAAGLVLTVAVAWGLEAWGPKMDSVFINERARWPVEVPEAWPREPSDRSRQQEFGRRYTWAGWRTEDGPGQYGKFIVEVHASGWPAKAMSRARFGELADSNRLRWNATGERRFPAWLGVRGGNRALPLRVWWPGLALNTVFYAGVVFLLWSAPGLARRGGRVRRGACTSCGYDLRGTRGKPCPECGA